MKRRAIVLATGALVMAAGAVQAAEIISNLPGNDLTQSAVLSPTRVKAMGFTMPAGTDYTLNNVVLRLNVTAANLAVVPVVAIYSDAAGNPSTLLITLNNPTFTTAGIADYTFTPPSAFTLQAGTGYWIVAYANLGATYDWKASSPAVTPTGLATHLGSKFGAVIPPTTNSVTLTSYSVNATAGGTPPCYANCDGSTIAPVLNVNDFTCFINRYAAADSYANCDLSTTPPTLNVNDFTCFLNRYAAGCR